MYGRILVPIDGSEAGAAGLEQAIKLGQSPDAKLRLIHVVNELILASPFVAGTFDPVGRRGIRRIVMGSDAELVLRTSPVPVLLARSASAG